MTKKTSYITPITDRTQEDVIQARANQADLVNKNKGAWNYTDLNRICNNLRYVADHMFEQGFLDQPYSMQLKTDWNENDIITLEQLNDMILSNINNLKTYSRDDLEWYYIASFANIDYHIANWIEKDIHALATQVPLPADVYKLTVENGLGSGEYEANSVITIQANTPEQGLVFSHWSGDHLENIENATAMITTYKMPHQDITLTANYTGVEPHTLKVTTYTKNETLNLTMGDVYKLIADPAPLDKVFHHWEIEPSQYEENLYEPSATTHFTMPNEAVTINAVYITKGQKHLIVENGKGSGWYEYDTYVSVSSNKGAGDTFTRWTGDIEYLTGDPTNEYNSVKIPDKHITIEAHWSSPPGPPAPPPKTDIPLVLTKGTIVATGEREGLFTQYDTVPIKADPPEEGWIFTYWSHNVDSYQDINMYSSNTTIRIKGEKTVATANYRELKYHNLKVTTHSGTTNTTLEEYDHFTVNAKPYPEGYTFDTWTGDTYSFNSSYYNRFEPSEYETGTYMGTSDRVIEAKYRPILEHTLTVERLNGESLIYTQDEFTSVNITAEPAPAGKRFLRWNQVGHGTVSSSTSSSIKFTFGNGDCTLKPVYINVWTIDVINGRIRNRGSENLILDEGSTYELQCRSLAIDERFDGWTITGEGTIKNTAAQITDFTVGAGNATITANISNYSDKTLTVYYVDPDTNLTSLVFSETYSHGTVVDIEAPEAPNKTTFSSWLGDIDAIIGNVALASTIKVSMTKDVVLTATYYYPESPEYFTLNVFNGYPEDGSYPAGSLVEIHADRPSEGWEFYKWYGDIQFLVDPDLTKSENAVIMPLQSIKLYAKFKVIGELPLFRVSVVNGVAKGVYTDEEGNVHNEGGENGTSYIDVPAGAEVTLIANPDTVGWVFDYWSGNFEAAGVTDIVTTNNPTIFTMVENDLNITMNRRELDKYQIIPKNASGGGMFYPGVYPIEGNLVNTDDKRYTFKHWACTDLDGNDCIEAIEDPSNINTTVSLTDKDLYVEAVYKTHYKLTVINGQDDGDEYYYEGEEVNTVYANTPEQKEQFDYWDDPIGIIKNIYDPTPEIIMKDSVAIITAVFTSLDSKNNSVIVTGDDLHSEIITRTHSTLISGVVTIGTIVLDKDGCIGVITEVDPDKNDNTDDYKVDKLFYGGNF